MRSLRSHYFATISGEAGGPAPLASALLYALSLPYSLAVSSRNLLFDKGILNCVKLPVPVVSVGNITAGGTGKTPLVELIVRALRRMGRRPAILSRGYKAHEASGDKDASGPAVNDEVLVLLRNLEDMQVHVGPDRVSTGRTAVEQGACDCLVMDDGFQHRRLARDLDIVAVDASRPFGYGRLLPRGLLREPVSALRRANLVVIAKTDLVDSAAIASIRSRIEEAAPQMPVIQAAQRITGFQKLDRQELLPPDALSGRSVLAACGIGNPSGFLGLLETAGVAVAERRLYPDHWHYTEADVNELKSLRDSCAADCIVVTQKDAVKMEQLPGIDESFYAMHMALELTEGAGLLEEKLRALSSDGVGATRPEGTD